MEYLQALIFIIFFSIIAEILSLILRLIFHLKSSDVEKKLKISGLKYSYISLFLSLVYIYSPNKWLFMIALSLALTDFIHNIIFLPLLQKYKFDITMAHHQLVHRYMRVVLGSLMLTGGSIALVMPIIPGSWLIPIGLTLLIGRKKASSFFKRLLGEKLFKFLRINKLLRIVK